MAPKTYVGVDNSFSAGLSILAPNQQIELAKMPVVEIGKHKLIDTAKLRMIFERARAAGDGGIHVIYELVGPQPIFSAKSNYGTGYCLGVVQTLLHEMRISSTAVTPKEWQKPLFVGIRGAKDDTKAASIEFCHRTFPEVSLLRTARCSKEDDNLADALCMAEWGRRNNL